MFGLGRVESCQVRVGVGCGKGERVLWAYRVIQRILIPRIIININCDVFQRGDFAGEGVEEFVILPAQCAMHLLAPVSNNYINQYHLFHPE
jgi:hypothetical protein